MRLVWLNSPSNPTGGVLGVEALAEVVAAARRIGAVVASDECYAVLPWAEPWVGDGVPSVLDPRVSGGSHDGLLALYSLSKQSNLAGYRAAFAAGDPALVAGLLEARKHIGMMVPGPVQAVMLAALDDDAHVAAQRERTVAAGPPCSPRSARPGTRSSRRPRACTCGCAPRARTAGPRWPTWRRRGSWSRPARSTARRAPSTSGCP